MSGDGGGGGGAASQPPCWCLLRLPCGMRCNQMSGDGDGSGAHKGIAGHLCAMGSL